MSARSEQLVLDYLSHAADAARGTLRSDERTRFVAALRLSIEQQRRATGAVEPADVRRVLATFGDPKVLVACERRRLDQAKPVHGDAESTGTPDPATQRAAEGAQAQGAAAHRTPARDVAARGTAARGAAAVGAAENGRTVPGTPEAGSAASGTLEWGATEQATARRGSTGQETAAVGTAWQGAAGRGTATVGAGGTGPAELFPAGQRRTGQSPAERGAAGPRLAEHGAPGWGPAENGRTVRRMAETGGTKPGAATRGVAEHGAAERGVAEHGAAERGVAEHGAAERGVAEHGAAWRAAAGQGPASVSAASVNAGGNGRAVPGAAEAAPATQDTTTQGTVRYRTASGRGPAGRGGASVDAGGNGRTESDAAERASAELDASSRNLGRPPDVLSRSPGVVRPGDEGQRAAAPAASPGRGGGADRGPDPGAGRGRRRQMWVSAGNQAPAMRQPPVARGRQRTGGTRRDDTGSGSGSGPTVAQPHAPGRPAPVGGHYGPVPVGGAPVRAVPEVAFDPISVVGRFPREMLSLVLLGLGGLLLLFPLWLIGTVISLTSRVWSTRDKFVGIVGALMITVAGIGVIGALNKNPSIPVDLHAYIAAAHADASVLLRFGPVLGAIYLGARLRHGDVPNPNSRRSDDRRRDLPGDR
jgi:hypothetical protein